MKANDAAEQAGGLADGRTAGEAAILPPVFAEGAHVPGSRAALPDGAEAGTARGLRQVAAA